MSHEREDADRHGDAFDAMVRGARTHLDAMARSEAEPGDPPPAAHGIGAPPMLPLVAAVAGLALLLGGLLAVWGSGSDAADARAHEAVMRQTEADSGRAEVVAPRIQPPPVEEAVVGTTTTGDEPAEAPAAGGPNRQTPGHAQAEPNARERVGGDRKQEEDAAALKAQLRALDDEAQRVWARGETARAAKLFRKIVTLAGRTEAAELAPESDARVRDSDSHFVGSVLDRPLLGSRTRSVAVEARSYTVSKRAPCSGTPLERHALDDTSFPLPLPNLVRIRPARCTGRMQ